jgi:hypothetical protein
VIEGLLNMSERRERIIDTVRCPALGAALLIEADRREA